MKLNWKAICNLRNPALDSIESGNMNHEIRIRNQESGHVEDYKNNQKINYKQ